MAETLRVMMLIQAYRLHNYGGAERQLASLVPLFRQRDIEVHILTRRHPGTKAYEEVQGVPVYRTFDFKNSILTSLAFSMSGLKHIRRLRPHVLHAHGLFSPTTTATTAHQMFGIPVVAKVLRGGVLGDVIRIKQKPMGQRRIAHLSKNVDRFITISEEIQQELIAEGVRAEKCYYIPNGVDVERFRPLTSEQKRKQREAMGLSDGPLVVYVGRLVPEKRVDKLIHSWETVRQKFPNSQLLIIGTGSEDATLQKLAVPNIQFVGRVDDTSTWLQVADLFVLPSISEGLSNSLLEAMACSLPIIATAVGAAPNLIRPQENGWCIPPDDLNALTDALMASLDNLDYCQPMGKRNRDRILNDFQLSVTADKLCRLYRELAN